LRLTPRQDVKDHVGATGLSERQVAEFVEDDEMNARKGICDAAVASGLDLGLELVNEVDDVEEAGLRPAPDAAACNRYGDVALARAGAADEASSCSISSAGSTSAPRSSSPPTWPSANGHRCLPTPR
jgi:hypothetical protein